jgi:hypothetical protein
LAAVAEFSQAVIYITSRENSIADQRPWLCSRGGGGAGGTRTHGQGIMSGPDVGACGLYLRLCPPGRPPPTACSPPIDSISHHERHHAAVHGVLPASCSSADDSTPKCAGPSSVCRLCCTPRPPNMTKAPVLRDELIDLFCPGRDLRFAPRASTSDQRPWRVGTCNSVTSRFGPFGT